MDTIMNNYLEKIDKYLKPMSASERLDIVKEIKSEMLELKANDGLTSEQIIDRLGSPKDLAKAYLSESISKNSTFSLKKFCYVIAFYSLAGFSGIFILPVFSIFSAGLIISGIITPIAGIIKFIAYFIGIDVPFVAFRIGSYNAHPVLVLPISIVIGILLFLSGKCLWKLMIKYIYVVGQKKQKLQNE